MAGCESVTTRFVCATASDGFGSQPATGLPPARRSLRQRARGCENRPMGRPGVIRRGVAYGMMIATLAAVPAVMIVTGTAGALGSRSGHGTGTLHVRFSHVDGVVDTNGPYTVITRPSGSRIVVDETRGERAPVP